MDFPRNAVREGLIWDWGAILAFVITNNVFGFISKSTAWGEERGWLGGGGMRREGMRARGKKKGWEKNRGKNK
jgi:hypothetical protein